MEDMYMGPTIPQVTLEYFLSSCLPPVDEGFFSKVYGNLKAKKVITEEGWDAMECDELEKRRARSRLSRAGEGEPKAAEAEKAERETAEEGAEEGAGISAPDIRRARITEYTSTGG